MKITTAMQVKLTDGELARIVAKGTNNIDAYLKALEANENVARFNQESNDRAQDIIAKGICYAFVLCFSFFLYPYWV